MSVLVSIALLTAAGCASGGGDTPSRSSPALRIVFLEDLSVPDAATMVVPAFHGAKLAFDAAARTGMVPNVDLLAEEVDPSDFPEVARALAGDRSVLAVIVGPFLAVPPEAAVTLDGAGVPVVSLSSFGPDLTAAGLTSWFGAVASVREESRAITAYLRRVAPGRVCLAGDGSPNSSALVAQVASELGDRAAPVEIPTPYTGQTGWTAAVSSLGCRRLFWAGSGPQAASIRLALDAAGLSRIGLVGSGAMKDPEFLAQAGPAGDGTVVACGCVDLDTSIEPSALGFIQNYQADFAVPPGPFSAEAWDMARMLLAAIRSGAVTRAAVLARVESLRSFGGLAGTYRFAPDGARQAGTGTIHFFRDAGERWLQARL